MANSHRGARAPGRTTAGCLPRRVVLAPAGTCDESSSAGRSRSCVRRHCRACSLAAACSTTGSEPPRSGSESPRAQR
eukprot:6949798-Prymnesium_polylepis.2